MDEKLRREYFDKAFMLQNAENYPEAENLYKKIINENPDDFEVLNLIGLCKLKQKDFYNAEIYIRKAIDIKKIRYFYETLSRVFYHKKNYEKEYEILKEEENIFGLDYICAFRLGLACRHLLSFEESAYYYEKAIEINPNGKEAFFNLANIYQLLHTPEKAIECYQRCITLDPYDSESKYFLGLDYFRLKDYENGLKYFETRLCRETAFQTAKLTYPNKIERTNMWQGEDISNKVLYTYYEAGFGDMIMFARYIPELQKRCKKLIIKPQIELSELFRENFPDVEVMDYFYSEKDLSFDVHIPFLSIPYILNYKTEDMFVGRNGYLRANEEKILEFKEKFFNNNKFKIGIKWQGNTYYETDRVINVEAFSQLFELENVQVYSAQTFEGAEEFEKLSSKYNIIDLSKSFTDFSQTAAAVANLDLVICNDTSLAHLAGAMNKQCAVLLPYNYNWRWHTDLKYCDWYESVKLYGANLNESWENVMDKVIADLHNLPETIKNI